MDVDSGDAVGRQRDRHGRTAEGLSSRRNGLDHGLPCSSRPRHLPQVSRAGEGLAIDGSYFCGFGAIDRDQDHAAWSGGVRARVNDHAGDIAGCGPKRGVAKVRAGSIEATKCAEARQRVGIRAVRRPEIRGENSLAAEDPKVIGLRDSAGYVVEATSFVFGDGELHPRIRGSDLGLEAGEDLDRRVKDGVGDPGIFCERWVPQAAGTLHDGLDLRVS